jgi:hypothetical protein
MAINDSLINRPLDPSGIAQMVNLHSAGLLSKRTVLEELQRGGVLDPDLRVASEIERIDKDAVANVPPQSVEPATQNPLATE